MLGFQLTPEQLEIQKKARAFALKEILPVAWHYDAVDDTPLPLLRKAWETGIMNTDIPADYGGKGYALLENVVITEELAAACPGLATSIFDSSLGMEPLRLSANTGLQEKYFPQIVKQFKLFCFATSEPTLGSDVAGIRCLATSDGEEYILNGTKYWVTNGGIADFMSIFATVDPEKKHDGVCGFVVEKDWEGVTIGRRIPKLGQRGSNTVGVRFKNVRVPKENVLAPPGEGFVLAMKTFARTRPAIGAFAVGAARSAMEFAIDYAKRRKAFGAPLASFQAIQHKLADMLQKVETSRLLVWKAAWEADQGMDPTTSASIAKLYATEAALEVANEALQIFAGYGYTKMFPIEKLLRDTRLFRIYEGTSEIQRLIIADYALGAFRPVMPPLEDLPVHLDRDVVNGPERATAWRCRICGHVHYGEAPPEECPYCFFPKSAFKKV
ncbi:MAG: acyl-CoA dehydrogenase family protein [Desulfobacterales bacterium]